jgi:hypothetical protein
MIDAPGRLNRKERARVKFGKDGGASFVFSHARLAIRNAVPPSGRCIIFLPLIRRRRPVDTGARASAIFIPITLMPNGKECECDCKVHP